MRGGKDEDLEFPPSTAAALAKLAPPTLSRRQRNRHRHHAIIMGSAAAV